MKKIISLILALSLVFSAMLGVVSFAAEDSGATEAPELKISHATLQFASTVYLLIAVNYGTADPDGVTVQITNKAGATTTLTRDTSVESTEGFHDGCVGFKYTKLSAQEFGDDLEIKALYNGKEQDSLDFSVLEYIIRAKSYGDTETPFDKVLSALQTLGAKAQVAFKRTGDWDYLLADGDDNIEYGLIILNGATEKDAICRVGEPYTPETTKANPLLYTLSYDRIENNTIKVQAGIQKAFYISESDKTTFHFDANLITLPAEKNDIVYSNNKAAMAKAVTTGIAIGTGVSCSFQMNAVDEGEDAIAKFVDFNGERVLEINAPEGYSVTISQSTNDLKSQVGDSRYFTLTLTVASNGKNALIGSLRLRDSNNSNNHLMSVSSNVIQAYTSTLSKKTVTALEANVLTTIHAVFDKNEKTVSYYIDGVFILKEGWSNTMDSFITGEGTNKRIHIYGGTYNNGLRAGYIQKIIVTKGNIFA